MAFNINSFREELEFGGARASLFSIELQNPVDGRGDDKIRFMARASALPTSSVGFSEIPYFGRTIKVAGQRRYDDWLITVMNDEDFAVRHALEAWHNSLNSHEPNLRDPGYQRPESYKRDGSVIQYSKSGEILRKYKFVGCFPSDISAIGLDWAQADVIEEFQVNFKYDYWLLDESTSTATTTTAPGNEGEFVADGRAL